MQYRLTPCATVALINTASPKGYCHRKAVHRVLVLLPRFYTRNTPRLNGMRRGIRAYYWGMV